MNNCDIEYPCNPILTVTCNPILTVTFHMSDINCYLNPLRSVEIIKRLLK